MPGLHRFWSKVIRPILQASEPGVVVEVGAGAGANSRPLAEFCRGRDCTLHVVDPAPAFDPAELGRDVIFHRGRSLVVLGEIGPVDVALIDGDHNWYTVHHELQLLQRTARSADRPTPLVLCHDVCWPYGRRDMYYDPETIPAEFRRPWERAGIVPGRSRLRGDRGLNARVANATAEGGPRNGVMTAIEDFVHAANESVEVSVLPVLHGLAIVCPRSRLEANPRLADVVAGMASADGLAELLSLVEQERLRLLVKKADRGRPSTPMSSRGETAEM